jgi:hypothetical protein
VSVGDQTTSKFGWKTSPQIWNDDAVYWDVLTGWKAMQYPPLHPRQGQPVSLSFAIEYEKPPARDPKWSQPPDVKYGRDVPSAYSDKNPMNYYYILDDFRCDGRPITGARWWGSYIGWMANTPPGSGPIAPPAGERPERFWLDWQSNIPAGVGTNYPRPSMNFLGSTCLPLLPWGTTYAPTGTILEQYYTSIAQVAGSTTNWEHEFVYDATLPCDWNEKEGTTYWFAVQAACTTPTLDHVWGWATTSPRHHWNGDAVEENFSNPYNWDELRYSRWPGHPYGTSSVDLAFVLYSDVVGRRARKWWQLPDMVYGLDMESFTNAAKQGPSIIRADDFSSDGRRITDIHWWGSYPGWRKDSSHYTQENPPPSPEGDRIQPAAFRLTWYAGGPIPGPILTNIVVPVAVCHETFYGTVVQDWPAGSGVTNYEHEFQYYVDLLDEDLRPLGVGPWLEEKGVPYWLSIQAVFTNDPVYEWGWKITQPLSMSPSLTSTDGGGMWQMQTLPADHPRGSVPYDLAFELTTDAAGANPWYQPIVISNLARLAASNYLVESVGDCGAGTQYLQACGNLYVTNWTDVDTNALPWPPPFRNPWYPPASAQTGRFFRVIQK